MDANTGFKARQAECVECGATFNIPVGEQEFMARKGLSDPRRCRPCRKARKEALANGQQVRHVE